MASTFYFDWARYNFTVAKRPMARYQVRGYRIIMGAASAGACMLCAFGDVPNQLVRWSLFAVFAYLAGRLSWLGADVIDGETLVMRNWFRTLRCPVDNVRSVTIVPYSGAWSRGGTVRHIDQLQVQRHAGPDLISSGIVGVRLRGSSSAERVARSLAAEIEKPFEVYRL